MKVKVKIRANTRGKSHLDKSVTNSYTNYKILCEYQTSTYQPTMCQQVPGVYISTHYPFDSIQQLHSVLYTDCGNADRIAVG